jgi:hypothetical protein
MLTQKNKACHRVIDIECLLSALGAGCPSRCVRAVRVANIKRRTRLRKVFDEQDTQSRPEPNARNLLLRAHQEHALPSGANIMLRTRPRNVLDEQETQTRPEPNSRNLFLRAHHEHGTRPMLLMSKTPSQDQSRTLAIYIFFRAHSEHGGGARAMILTRTNTRLRPEPNSRNFFLRAHQEHALRGSSRCLRPMQMMLGPVKISTPRGQTSAPGGVAAPKILPRDFL